MLAAGTADMKGFAKTLQLFSSVVPIGAMVLALSACTSLPQTAYVQDPELPDYRTGGHRIDEPFDLWIEPRIPALTTSVTPRSDDKAFPEITVVAGPALENALLTLTRQHFSHVTPVDDVGGKPTLSYRILTFKPVMTVVPGALRSQLIVSARLALQVTVQSATGESLFSSTAIGTSHVSDTKFSPGKGLKDSGQLVEVVTRNAIIDAMYEISKIFGNSGESIRMNVRRSGSEPNRAIETFDDVVLFLQTVPGEQT